VGWVAFLLPPVLTVLCAAWMVARAWWTVPSFVPRAVAFLGALLSSTYILVSLLEARGVTDWDSSGGPWFMLFIALSALFVVAFALLLLPRFVMAARVVGWMTAVAGWVVTVLMVALASGPPSGQAMGIWLGFVTFPSASLAIALTGVGLSLARAGSRAAALGSMLAGLALGALCWPRWLEYQRHEVDESEVGVLFGAHLEVSLPGAIITAVFLLTSVVLLRSTRRPGFGSERARAGKC